MEQYGYLYNKLAKDIGKFSTAKNLSLKTGDNSGFIYIWVFCALVMIAILKFA
jgi:hypothetical protein